MILGGIRKAHKQFANYLTWLGTMLGLIFLCLFTLNSYAYAQDIPTRRTVRVGYYNAIGFQDYDPWSNTYSGSGYEYLMALKQYTNWNLVFIHVDFSTGLKMLQEGKIDLLNNVSKTKEREKTLDFSQFSSGANYGTLTVDINNTIYAYNDYESFNQMRIGIKQDSVYRSSLEEFLYKFRVKPQKLIYYETLRDMNDAYINGEIDTKVLSSSYHDDKIKAVTKFAPMEYFFAVTKGNTALLQELNTAMEALETDIPGIAQQLETRYEKNNKVKTVVLTSKEKNFVLNNGLVTVAVANDWSPVAYYSEKGGYQGVLANIFKRLSKDTGLFFKFVPFNTYEESLVAVSRGEVDMVAHCPYDFVFADKWYLRITNKIQDVNVFRVINGNDSNESINRIGVYGNDYMNETLRNYYGDKVKFIHYKDVNEAIDGVLEGEVDCTYINQFVATNYQNNGKYLPLKFILVSPMKYYFTMGISENKNPLLKSILSKGLDVITDEYIDELFQQEEKANNKEDFETQMHRNPGLVMLVFGVILGSSILVLGFAFYSKRMAKKNTELEQARMAQTDFLSRMSHDMRTPMNGILGLSYLMEKEPSLETVKGYIPQLRESSKYLLQLINDVLDVNKISAGHMEIKPQVCNEEILFNTIVKMIEPQMHSKNITFNFIKHNIEWKYMFIDEQRVKQIFMNLLNNAVKFTPRGGQIDFIMELVSESETVIRDKFVVKDNGIGIGPEFLPHLFEAFTQEYNDNTDYSNGTGLGLSIVKKLVELMDGTIEVKSELGKGTEFILYLNFPLTTKPKELLNDKEQPKTTTHLKRPKLQILLCEDHALNATIAKKLLEKQEAIVTWAKNGQEGLDLFQQSAEGFYDLVLMDIRMPLLDGIDCAKAIRALIRKDAKTVPIIAMSANAYQEDINKSLAAGMNSHLPKPVDPKVLYAEINKYVK